MPQYHLKYLSPCQKRQNKRNSSISSKAKSSLNTSKGFTLIELMVAMALGAFIILGVIGTYSSISASSQVTKELENAQEVIRYSSQVFTRSLKQTTVPLTFANGNQTITVTQKANSRSCLGTLINVDYNETFTFSKPNLSCQISNLAGVEIAANTILLTGIADFQSALVGNLFTLSVTPTALPLNFGTNGVRIDIALTTKIMREAMNAP
tara:strand:- start:501 stop:1127 length:627 start_codon:yes stop_codon:yes gene_type:complete